MPNITRKASVRTVTTQAWSTQTDARATDGMEIVYYIRRPDGSIKIGTTKRPVRRMAEHRRRTGATEVLAIEFGGRDLERERHAQFAGERIGSSECFTPTPALMAHIEELQRAIGLTA